MPSSHLILYHPLLLLPPIPPSISVFSNESALPMRWPKYWSFSFSISPSNEHPGLISFRMDSLDLLAVQGTLKSRLQHHSSKASIFRHSAFFIVQLSHPYMSTGKTIALTRWTFVGKAMSLLFKMLSRLVITFLPRSKRLLISWLQSSSAMILEPNKIKSDTVSTVSPPAGLEPSFSQGSWVVAMHMRIWAELFTVVLHFVMGFNYKPPHLTVTVLILLELYLAHDGWSYFALEQNPWKSISKYFGLVSQIALEFPIFWFFL